MTEERKVLCGANSYTQKYYFNPEFSGIPEQVKKELQVLCVLFTEDVGGALTLEYTPEGTLMFSVSSEPADYLFDEIGSELKIRELQRNREALFESLETYYKVVFLGETDGEV